MIDTTAIIFPEEIAYIEKTTGKVSKECTDVVFTALLRSELELWQKIGPYPGANWPQITIRSLNELESNRTQIRKTFTILKSLKGTSSVENIGVVRELRDYWISLRQLRGVDDIVDACDSILKGDT